MNQVEHVLKLADEYQTGGIIDVCVKILKSEPKSEGNAVKILHLATCTATVRKDEWLFWVREQCYKLIENMELKETQKDMAYDHLEKGTLERVLVKRNQRLETFIKDIYMWDSVKMTNVTSLKMDPEITACPQHYQNRKAKGNLLGRMKNCSVCRRMITQLVRNLKLSQQTSTPFVNFQVVTPSEGAKFKYGGDYYFDEKVIAMIQDF